MAVVKAKKAVKKESAVKKTVVKELAKETGLKLSVYDLKGLVSETVELPKEIFGAKINKTLIAQAVRVYLANQRRGTLKTKSRGEVKISTRKIYKQKGTGRARHGAASAPIFVGGGIAFGPRQRDFSLKMNQKMKKAALISALSAKLKDGEIFVLGGLEKIEPKTKKMADVLNNLGLSKEQLKKSKANRQLLLVVPSLAVTKEEKGFTNVSKAARNIDGLAIATPTLLNTYQVLANKKIIFMKDSLAVLKEALIK